MGHVGLPLNTSTHPLAQLKFLTGYRRSDGVTILPFAFLISALKSESLLVYFVGPTGLITGLCCLLEPF